MARVDLKGIAEFIWPSKTGSPAPQGNPKFFRVYTAMHEKMMGDVDSGTAEIIHGQNIQLDPNSQYYTAQMNTTTSAIDSGLRAMTGSQVDVVVDQNPFQESTINIAGV